MMTMMMEVVEVVDRVERFVDKSDQFDHERPVDQFSCKLKHNNQTIII